MIPEIRSLISDADTAKDNLLQSTVSIEENIF